MESDAETAKRALAELTRRIDDAERRVAPSGNSEETGVAQAMSKAAPKTRRYHVEFDFTETIGPNAHWFTAVALRHFVAEHGVNRVAYLKAHWPSVKVTRIGGKARKTK